MNIAKQGISLQCDKSSEPVLGRSGGDYRWHSPEQGMISVKNGISPEPPRNPTTFSRAGDVTEVNFNQTVNRINKMEGIITNIQKFSTGDGPGIRTTIFIKGCPLRCLWCQNPETWRLEPQLAWYQNKCIFCGNCAEICPNDAISIVNETLVPDYEKCETCGKCVEECPKGAREILGEKMSVDEVLSEVEKDKVFYDKSGGGVTVSGGEPLSQPEFTKEILKECVEEDIHTALDTSGYADAKIFDDILSYVDLVLYDLKHMGLEKHEEFIGVLQEKILENLEMIDEKGNKIWIRTPIIPGYTDSEENIEKIARFVEKLNNVERYDLLPYNPLVESDYKNIDMKYKLEGLEKPTEEEMQKLKNIANSYDLKKVSTG